jgi:beta-glucosidase
VEADDIVQLYTRQTTGSLARPVRELKGFRRVHLKPGEKQSMEFSLKSGDLAFHKGAQLVTEPGKFQVWIAPDSAAGTPAQFVVTP